MLTKLSSPAGLFGSIGLALLILLAILGPVIWGDDAAARSIEHRWEGASLAHPFGTDDLGRDILARVLVATRLTLVLTFGATVIGVGGGLLVGLTASVLPTRPRRVLIWFMDMLLAFPWLLLVLFFTVIWGATSSGAMIAIGIAAIPQITRLVYNLAASVSGQDFVRAARVVGVNPVRVLFKHVLPNIASPLLVQASASASLTLLSFASLSFLGLGVQAPEYDWGRLLNEGVGHLYVNPMAGIGPGIAVVVAGIVFTLLSEALGEQPGSGLRAFTAATRAAVLANAERGEPDAQTAPVVSDPGPPPLAEVRDLRVSFPDRQGNLVERVHGVSLAIRSGEVVGIVGESGSGKSLTAMALAGLLDTPAVVSAQQRVFDGIDLDESLTREQAKRLGIELGVVFQDPMTSLNPALTIGRQLTEVPITHLGMSSAAARERAEQGLEAVGIGDPKRRLRAYPHEFSGGMRQRVMIGMALTGAPRLIIADEPTTALDVTVQRQVLGVLRRAQQATGAAIVFISHDIALVSGFCDRVIVMRDGRIVEEVDAQHIRDEAQDPYTRGLIACLPDMASDRTQPLPVVAAQGGR